ncbi:MAG: hypothetical protein ACLTX3_08585 [Lachnospiraceae bacterium]
MTLDWKRVFFSLDENRGKRIGYQVVYEYKGTCCPLAIHRSFRKRRSRKNTEGIASNIHGQIRNFSSKKSFMKENPERTAGIPWKRGLQYGVVLRDRRTETGDLVDSDIVDLIINCLPPACMRSDCTQLGEPTDHRMDEDTLKPVFATFRKIEW